MSEAARWDELPEGSVVLRTRGKVTQTWEKGKPHQGGEDDGKTWRVAGSSSVWRYPGADTLDAMIGDFRVVWNPQNLRPGRWWRALDKDGDIWAESSNEREIRASAKKRGTIERLHYHEYLEWVEVD